MLKCSKQVETKQKPIIARLSDNAVFGRQIIKDDGKIFFEWEPRQSVESTTISRVAAKTLRLGKLSDDAVSSGNYKCRDEYSMIFVPSNSSSTDVKLLILRNTADKQFMMDYAP